MNCQKYLRTVLLRAESFFLEIGHVGYYKKLMLISKIPPKLKLKNVTFAFENRFLSYPFRGHFVTEEHLHL